MKQKKLFLLMFSSVLLSSTFISCEGNGMYGIEEDLYPYSEEMESVKTRAAYTEYLYLPTYDPKKWNQENHDIVALAAERMGISFVNNCYVFAATSGKEVNISDSLFITVKEQFGYTNKILNETSFKTVNRLKRGNFESPNTTPEPNCVPKAISNMGQSAPSYSSIVSICDIWDPDWRTTGGVSSTFVGPLIRLYTSVKSMASLPADTLFTTNRCVMLINKGGIADHAVNATSISKSGNGHTIFYVDYSSSGNGATGSINSAQMTAIYPFLN